MEPPTDLHRHELPEMVTDSHSTVDSSRPFRSVKEAVAIFGEKFLACGEIYSPKPFSFPKQETPYFSPTPQNLPQPPSTKSSGDHSIYSDETSLVDTLKKLEFELEETKTELNLLKERESETEVALASLNAELHKNMSKMAKAEAAIAAKAATAVVTEGRSVETSRSLVQILNSTGGGLEMEDLFAGRKRERKIMKKKPIIPLVGDLFSRKKDSSTSMNNPLFSSSHVQWN